MAAPKVTRPFTGATGGQLSPYQTNRTSPDDFGAGVARSVGQGGSMLFGAGADMANREIRDREIANDSQARDLVTQYKQSTIELWGQYGSTMGKNAVDGWEGYRKGLEEQQKRLLTGIGNERVKQAALDGMKNWQLNMLSSGQTHYMREERTWGLESAKAEQDQAIASANLFREDFTKVHKEVDEGVVALARSSRLQGDSPEEFAAKEAAYRGQAYGTVIDNLAGNDPLRAQALFQSVRDRLDPVSQAKIAESLRPKVTSAKADIVVQGVINGNTNAAAEEHISYLMGKGIPRMQAAAIVGHLQQESSLNPEAVGDNGTAFGLAQWREDRFENLKRFAKANGLDPRTKEAQLDFLLHELATSERESGEGLRGAKTMDEAVAAFMSFERPKGWTKSNPRGGDAWDRRLKYAASFAGEGGRPAKNMMAAVYEATKGDPEVQRIALSRMQQSINAMDTANAQTRARLKDQASDTKTALLAGQNVTIPETEIRLNFDEDAANQILGELNTAKVTGQAIAGLGMSTPDEIATARADISTGQGPISDIIRKGLGIGASEADRAKDIATRLEVQAVFDRAIAARDKAISDDPAAYVAQKDETVHAALTVLRNDQTPDGWRQYVVASDAAQDRLGIPKSNRRILTEAQRQAFIDNINNAEPMRASQMLEGWRDQMGEFWPQVFGEISGGKNGIPPEYVALGTIAEGDAVGRATLAQVLQNEREKKGSTKASAATLGSEVPNSIAQNVEQGMADYLRTFTAVKGGVPLATGVIDAAKLLAWNWAPTLGEGKAVQQAIKTMSGMWDIEISRGAYVARAPQGLGMRMRHAADYAKRAIDQNSLVPLADSSGTHTPEQILKETIRNAQNGYWVTSPSSDGWTLIGHNGQAVMRYAGLDSTQHVGRGKRQRMVPVTLSFDDVKYDRAPLEMPQAPSSLGLLPTRPAGEDPRGRPYQ